MTIDLRSGSKSRIPRLISVGLKVALGSIRGAPNIVPDHAELLVNVRKLRPIQA